MGDRATVGFFCELNIVCTAVCGVEGCCEGI